MPYADPETRKAYAREKHAQNRDAVNSGRTARYRAANKEEERAKRRAWYEANRERALALERERQYRIKYGITTADYDRMLADQDGKCAICGTDKPHSRPPGARYAHRYFAVDHCHITGKVRGLLCSGCNVKVGIVESELIDKVFNYVAKHAPEVQ